MTDAVLAALRAAVTIAKNERISRVAMLRVRVEQAGHSPEDTQAALVYWANREKGKR